MSQVPCWICGQPFHDGPCVPALLPVPLHLRRGAGDDDKKLLLAVSRAIRHHRATDPGSTGLFLSLTDEFAHLGQVLLETHRRVGDDGHLRIRESCTRLAALALRIAEEGDPAFAPRKEDPDV